MKINKPVSTIIIFVITLVLIFLFIMPNYKKLYEAQNVLAQKQEEYDNKYIYYAKISDFIKDIDTRREALEKINSALPTDFYLSSVAYFFHQKGSENDLDVKSIVLSKVSVATQENNVRDITFNVHLLGTYGNFKNFISSLDKSARLFEVNYISFNTPAGQSPSQTKNPQQIYDFNVEVQTHIY